MTYVLKVGSRGPDVQKLQQGLIAAGLLPAADARGNPTPTGCLA